MREELSPIRPTTNSKIWQAHVSTWRKSGLSKAAYCRQYALSYHAFNYWKKKADRQKNTAVNFVPVPAIRIGQLADRNHPPSLKVDLGNSLKIEVHDGFTPVTLSQVVQALRGY